MTFWKLLPPGWFAFESDQDYGDGDLHEGGGDDGGDGGSDEGGDDDEGDDEEGDGDGGIDFRHDDDGGNDDGGNDFDRDNNDREREDRRREEDDRRRREDEQRRREEEERQRRIDEQHRQIEEERRRQEEEERRRQQQQQTEDSDGDGIPDQGTLEDPSAVPSSDPGIGQRLEQQFQSYEEQRQAQAQAFDPTNPGWIYQSEQTQAERTPSQATTNQRDYGPIDRETAPQNLREPGRDYDPRTSDILTAGPAYKPPAFYRSPEPEPEPAREPIRPPETRVPEIAATAAAKAAAAIPGATPQQIAETAEHAARIASDQQTLATQSAWTRASFRSTYGPNAEAEWARQHEAELARNRSLYGASEPRASQAPLANAPAGTPLAPDRRIGQVAPPTAGQTARYGINGIAPAQPAQPPGSVRAPAPGTVTPAAQGLPGFPPPPASGTAAPPVVGPGTQPNPNAIVAPRPPGQPREPEPGQGAGSYPPPVPIGAPSALPRTTAPTTPPERDSSTSYQVPPAGLPTDTRGYDEGPRESGYNVPQPDEYFPDDILTVTKRDDPFSTHDLSRAEWDAALQSRPDLEDLWRVDTMRRSSERAFRSLDPATYQASVATGQRMDLRPGTAAPGQAQQQTPGITTYASTDTAIPRPSTVPTDYGPGVASPAPHADPVLAAISTTRPLDTLATLAATNKGPDYDPRADATHIANGIAAMLRGDRDANGQYVTWAEPYLNDVARIAWAREERQNGRNSDPRNTPVEYVEKWKDGFYGGDERVPMVKELQQEMIDHAAARTPPGQPFKWQEAYGPTGEKGLISQQINDADCGPNAFSTILRSRGYNADPKQAFNFASTNGYWNRQRGEFNGPAAMVTMVEKEAGLQAQQVGLNEQGWAAVDKELAEGRPVMLSGPGHWWVVSAKNEQGQYFAGPTALKGNSQWLPRGGFRFNGAADTAVLVRGDVDPNSKSVQTMGLKPPQKGQPNTRPLLSGQTEFMGGPPRGQGPTSGPSNTQEPENFAEYVRYGASKRGLDPEQVAAVMGKEGPEGWGSVGRFDSGTSYGPLQLHYAGGPQPQVGMGDAFTKATGIDLRTVDPKTPEGIRAHKMAVDYALDQLIKTGDYREWYGADKAFPVNQGGKGRFTPIRRIAPQRVSEQASGGESLMARANLGTSDSNLGMPESLENVRFLSPRERLGNRLSMEMYRQSSGGVELPDFPGDYDPRAAGRPNLPPPAPDQVPAWWAEANPNAGLYAGEGRGRDVGAQVWTTAYDLSDGDARFATLVAGLVNGEGGYSGKKDDVGATGIFQFDPRYAEGKEFKKWLDAQGIQEDPQRAARNVKYAMGYYAPYLKDAYDDAVARGVSDDVGLMRALVTGPSRRGYGHNSGSSGANFQNYVKGLEEFKRGEFRLLDRKQW